MKHLDMEKATKRYNSIMWNICVEHKTIGTKLSEDTDGWNIRDMVCEADYWLSCYHESGHCRYEDRLLGEDEYKDWLSEKGKLERFVKAYLHLSENVIATEKHCSQYDNA